MTRLSRFLRNLLERVLGRYYEGPRPPPRLAEEVRFFRAFKPLATPEEWERFAVSLAGRSYRDGFVRGNEWLERSWEGPAVSPERLAEARAHDWSLAETDANAKAFLDRAGQPRSAREIAEARDFEASLRAANSRLMLVPGRRERR